MSNFLVSIFTFPPPACNYVELSDWFASKSSMISPGLCVAFCSDPILDWTFFRLGDGAFPTSILFIGISVMERFGHDKNEMCQIEQ
jgi:hypothetical protein